jgi:hypothetical protein
MIRHSFLTRTASVAVACSLALALPVSAQAQEPEEPGFGAVGADLSPQARPHVIKAIQQFKSQSYLTAEAELRRAAFFSPGWRPLHFNLGVLAEAQGKLGTAISEYKQFKAVALPDEAMVAEQRIVELDERRRKISSTYRRQISVAATTMAIGAGMLGGGITLFLVAPKKSSTTDDLEDSEADTANDKKRTTYFTAGYILALVGVLTLIYSFVPLSKSVKSKRQRDGLALGPTRLKLNGGGGVTLKF